MGTTNNIFKYEEISIVDTDDVTIVSTKQLPGVSEDLPKEGRLTT